MTHFCPTPWPEETTPDELKNCKDCGLYKHGTRMVWGEGNPEASIMIILDNPGARENRQGKEFVCGTRHTLQQTAKNVGLNENDLYVTYILKRRPTRSYDKDRTRQTCMIHLNQQLQNKQPAFIFCLGNVAVQAFFQNPNADVKTARGKMHNIRGYQTAVAYHPLAIRRRPNLLPSFLEDWTFVANHYRKDR